MNDQPMNDLPMDDLPKKGGLSTHVLDTSIGRPAEGVGIAVRRVAPDGQLELLVEAITNADGRTDAPLLDGDAFIAGVYELSFAVGGYFAATAAPGPGAAPFLDVVPVRFATAGGEQLHVPLLVTPWSYSTYRGS
jgi:5-hydroxyisourate hydrolase